MYDDLARARFLRPKSSWLNEVPYSITNRTGSRSGEVGGVVHIQYTFNIFYAKKETLSHSQRRKIEYQLT